MCVCAHLSVGVFYCGVILLHKNALHKLDCLKRTKEAEENIKTKYYYLWLLPPKLFPKLKISFAEILMTIMIYLWIEVTWITHQALFIFLKLHSSWLRLLLCIVASRNITSTHTFIFRTKTQCPTKQLRIHLMFYGIFLFYRRLLNSYINNTHGSDVYAVVTHQCWFSHASWSQHH